ncbi:MAG TPA: tetratricopeptide repeat protein [Thermoanaerobaculia bacterium]|nr:tetratricopeptide repeat protein [Thermoanaerobaculia bacterium]
MASLPDFPACAVAGPPAPVLPAQPADTAGDGSAPAAAGRRGAHLLALGLALATVVTWLPVLDGGFVNYDDPQYVTENPQVRAGLTAAGLRWALTANVAGHWHPLALVSHMLDCQLYGLDPRGHHLTSLLLHLGCVLLLFGLLRRMTGAPLRSAAAAALFALHPLRVESVAWVAERKDVLCALFYLAAVAAYVHYSRRPGPARHLAVSCALALALAAKAMAMTLPLVLLLLDFWPLGRLRTGAAAIPPGPGAQGRLLPLIREKLPWLGLALAAGALAVHTQAAPLTAGATAPLGLRVANALTSYTAYLLKMVDPRRLGAFYPFPQAIAAWKAAAAAALLLAISLFALALARRAPYLIVGWLWYLVTLAPVAGVLLAGLQGMADRYTYLPSIGLGIAFVWGVADLARLAGRRLGASRQGLRAALAGERPGLAGGALLVLLVPLAWQTRQQIATWSDTTTLFRHALAVAESWVAHTNLAEELRLAGAPGAAALHYRAALALEPRNPQSYAALGSALRGWGQAAAALPWLRQGLALDPDDERLRITLAMALDDVGRSGEAAAELERVVRRDPDSLRAHQGLAALYAKQGRPAEAELHRLRAAALAAQPTRVGEPP